jgi:hypothetical protein
MASSRGAKNLNKDDDYDDAGENIFSPSLRRGEHKFPEGVNDVVDIERDFEVLKEIGQG